MGTSKVDLVAGADPGIAFWSDFRPASIGARAARPHVDASKQLITLALVLQVADTVQKPTVPLRRLGGHEEA